MRWLLLAWFWLFLCAPSWGQTLGTISGEVKDSTGAVIPGVTVTVVNKATNATRTSISNGVGLFDFPALPPGPYSGDALLLDSRGSELTTAVDLGAAVDCAHRDYWTCLGI